jgi:hypothetical protein
VMGRASHMRMLRKRKRDAWCPETRVAALPEFGVPS